MNARVSRSTLLLGGTAAALIGLLVLQAVLPSDVQPVADTVGDSETVRTAVVALPGAPPELSLEDLEKRYDPVLAAGLFEVRSFKDVADDVGRLVAGSDRLAVIDRNRADLDPREGVKCTWVSTQGTDGNICYGVLASVD